MWCDTTLLLLVKAESDRDRALCMQVDATWIHICKAAHQNFFFFLNGDLCSAGTHGWAMHPQLSWRAAHWKLTWHFKNPCLFSQKSSWCLLRGSMGQRTGYLYTSQPLSLLELSLTGNWRRHHVSLLLLHLPAPVPAQQGASSTIFFLTHRPCSLTPEVSCS